MKLIEKQTKQGTAYFENERGEVVSKFCTGTCGKVKPLEEFTEDPNGIGGKYPYCRTCKNESNKRYDASPRGKATHFVRRQKERIQVAQEKHGQIISNTLNPLHVQMEYGSDECVYCEKDLAPEDVHIDHPFTYRRGGTNDVTNILACCQTCNSKKGSKPLYEFLTEHVTEDRVKYVVFTLAQRNGITYEDMLAYIKAEAKLEIVSKGQPPKYDRESFNKSSDVRATNLFDYPWATVQSLGLAHLFANEEDFAQKKLERNEAINVEKVTIEELENYYPIEAFEGKAWAFPEIEKVETWIHAETGEEILVHGETLEFLSWVVDEDLKQKGDDK